MEATGFVPGEEVTVTLHSTTVVLGTVTAGADGSISYAFTVPAGLEAGPHTVVLAGSTTSVTVSFEVADTTEELPSTGGGQARQLGLFGLAAIAAGLGAVLISRRIS